MLAEVDPNGWLTIPVVPPRAFPDLSPTSKTSHLGLTRTIFTPGSRAEPIQQACVEPHVPADDKPASELLTDRLHCVRRRGHRHWLHSANNAGFFLSEERWLSDDHEPPFGKRHHQASGVFPFAGVHLRIDWDVLRELTRGVGFDIPRLGFESRQVVIGAVPTNNSTPMKFPAATTGWLVCSPYGLKPPAQEPKTERSTPHETARSSPSATRDITAARTNAIGREEDRRASMPELSRERRHRHRDDQESAQAANGNGKYSLPRLAPAVRPSHAFRKRTSAM